MFVALVALFGAGVASVLSPCVLPLVPVWLGIATGEAGEGRAFAASLGFVAGFTCAFAALGALVGSFAARLSSRTATDVGAALVAAFGVALIARRHGAPTRTGGHDRGQAPIVPARMAGALRRLGDTGPFALGLAFGVAWTPCVGPLLGAALTTAAVGGGSFRGALLLAAYAAGLGVPFLLAAWGLGQWQAVARSCRRRARGIERASGAGLLALAVGLAAGWVGG